jgi:hypothetical protein
MIGHMDRITAIRKSLTGFVCGIVGFLPIIGLVPAVYALVCWRQVQTRYGREWNPAEVYLSVGARLALLGVLGSALIIAIAVVTFGFDAFN